MDHNYAIELIQYARKHGGFTLNTNTCSQLLQGDGGYILSIGHHEVRTNVTYNDSQLAYILDRFVDTNIHLLESHGVYLGCWINGEHVYFDVCQRVATEYVAYQLCKERGEQAWFDVDKQTSMFVADYEIHN